ESSDIQVSPTSYGYGGDTLAVAVILSGLSTVFLLGKPIHENLDAWIKLGSRLRQFVLQTGRKYGVTLLSEPPAFAIALEAIKTRRNDMPSVTLLKNSIIRAQNRSLTAEAHKVFTIHPDRYYVF